MTAARVLFVSGLFFGIGIWAVVSPFADLSARASAGLGTLALVAGLGLIGVARS
jgi:hypothetical protein